LRVLVIGAYGLIGTSVVLHLLEAGHDVIGVGRSVATARRRFPQVRWIEVDMAKRLSPDDWAADLRDVDAIVHVAGLLQDGAGDDVRSVQVHGTASLYSACERAGPRRIIHVSAIGSSEAASTKFMTSKAEADRALMERELDWVIVRPALVIGRNAYGGTALLRTVAALPWISPIPRAARPIQVIDIDDLADTIVRLLAAPHLRHVTFDVAHPEKHGIADLVRALRAWLGLARGRTWPVPMWLIKLPLALGEGAAWLGWRNPLRTTAVQQLAEGVVGRPEGWLANSEVQPASLDDILRRHPATVGDLWHARMFVLKPLVFGTLSLFWLATGLITLTVGHDPATALLRSAGFGASAPFAATAGGLVDLAIGLLAACRRTVPLALSAMVLVSLAYLVAATWLLPSLWADPLGPLVKIVPIILLTLVAAAILPSR
jgi:uncharacterized protein YbjT (DUF2867 family)